MGCCEFGSVKRSLLQEKKNIFKAIFVVSDRILIQIMT